jgi:predicted F0F1-ATPase subunit
VNQTKRENGDQIQRFDININHGFQIKPKNKSQNHDVDDDKSWYYLGIFGQIGFSIALPIVICLIIGSKMDQYFNTYPRMTLGFLLFGIVISVVGFVSTIIKVSKDK